MTKRMKAGKLPEKMEEEGNESGYEGDVDEDEGTEDEDDEDESEEDKDDEDP